MHKMNRLFRPLALGVGLLLSAALGLRAQNVVKPYFQVGELPDLVKCLPPPPAFDSPEFGYDMMRYAWGKQQRSDSVRAAIAKRDAVWSYEALLGEFAVPFGLAVSEQATPEIWKLMVTALTTTDAMRVAPKAYYHRQRPFERFDDKMLTGEENDLRGEGSYPSGHTMRGWTCALLLAEVAPQRADTIFARGWIYGESRVIAGAHWQSDVDASRVAASIAYDALHASPEFRAQMLKAQAEYAALTAPAGLAVAENDASQFVNLADAVPDAILEIRYFGTYNFVGERIDGYEQPTALLTRRAAAALKAVSDEVMRQGYRLKIYDAYRPQKAVDHFVRWAANVPDTKMKDYFYPDLDKSVLFKQEYIMDHSGHTRGSTVDLTLFDMKTEKELDMGGTFDWFGPESHPDFCGNPDTGKYTGNNSKSPKGRTITARQFANRMILRRAMMAHGFKPLSTEWWHFTLKDEPFPSTYFTFPVNYLP